MDLPPAIDPCRERGIGQIQAPLQVVLVVLIIEVNRG